MATVESRRERYSRKLPRPNTEDRIELNLDSGTLDLMCRLLVTDSQNIRRGSLIHLQQLMDITDTTKIEADTSKKMQLAFIHKGLDARLNHNLSDPDMILTHIAGGIADKIDERIRKQPLNGPEIEWLNNMISEALNLGYMDKYIDRIGSIYTRYKAQDYGSKGAIIKEFEEAVSDIQNQFRKNRHETESEQMFSLEDEQCEGYISDVYDDMVSPRNKLKTGMQGLNELLSGGFENGRVYTFFGLQGEGKSMTLLNLARQIKKYNRGYKCKDPTKKPCVVLLTMENGVKETVQRLFSIATNLRKMTDVSKDSAIKMFREGDMYLDEKDPINIFIKFKPSNSVDTSYLYTLYDDLADAGYECICMIQDYIGRIRSTSYNQDLRIEFGQVVDEMKVFAEVKDIPVITAGQLNRDATKHVDEGRKASKADVVRLMGRSNIGESMLILNNIDGGYLLAPEITRTGERYLGIQCIKHRYDPPDIEFVYIPYHENSTIKLSEDYGMEPNFKITLREDMFAAAQTVGPKTSPYQLNAIRDIDDIMSENDTIFSTEVISNDTIEDIGDLEAACKSNVVDKANTLIDPMYINLIDPMVMYTNYRYDACAAFVPSRVLIDPMVMNC